MRKGLYLLLAAALAAANVAGYAQSGWKPEKSIEIVVGSSAGTGTDKTARLIQGLWQEHKMMDFPATVVNRPGGGGAISWAYLNQRAGDPHVLLVTSYNIVTGHINGTSKLTYTDFTPITLLLSEYIAYSVRADSPIKSVGDLVSVLKKDPAAIPIGISSSVGGANHIALGLLMKAAGIDVKKMKVVVFPGSGAATAALLGGHVALFVNSLSATAGSFANGTSRPLAIAAPKRAPGIYAPVPTLSELGMPVIADNWRLVLAARGLSEAQVSYWDNSFKRLAASEEWNKELQANHMSNNYLTSAETLRYIKQQYGEIKEILTDLGLARAPAAQ
jgi:putative tricarboxylic transport membrane protein